MPLNADVLIDRSYLKGQIAKWRAIAILVVVLAAIAFTIPSHSFSPTGHYIARVSIEGILLDDIKRDELFEDLAKDDQVKAVIVRMDSPGGTVVGGEQLYLNVQSLKKKKPVVVVMRSMAASAGYMATLGADRIFARQGTLTGSIGVIMQTGEVTELAKKVGIEPLTIKSGPNKATPNPFEKATPENIAVMKGVVDNYYHTFVTMVAENRKLPREKVMTLADGRVYTGVQAVENGLVDQLGGEEEAREWLASVKHISKDMAISDREPEEDTPSSFADFFGKAIGNIPFLPKIKLDGLVSIWQPM